MVLFRWLTGIGFMVLWAQGAKYPPNPYAGAFAQAYARHPSVPRGLLEAIAWRESRFSPLYPTEACISIPQGWGLFGWIAAGENYFRENLYLIAEKTHFLSAELQKNPFLQIEALAKALSLIHI